MAKLTEGNALIIFDDVRDYDQITSYLPSGKESRFRVLITTRFSYLGVSLSTINLDVLTAAQALDLLQTYLGKERLTAELEGSQATLSVFRIFASRITITRQFSETSNH